MWNIREYEFFISTHGKFTRIDYALGHKASLNILERISIIQMIQFCFQYYWISSYQSDPSADDRRYKIWKKPTWRCHRPIKSRQILIRIDTWKKETALSKFPGFMAFSLRAIPHGMAKTIRKSTVFLAWRTRRQNLGQRQLQECKDDIQKGDNQKGGFPELFINIWMTLVPYVCGRLQVLQLKTSWTEISVAIHE